MNNYDQSIVKLIRFCKEYGLYDSLQNNFRSLDDLTYKLSYYSIANYISIILKSTPTVILMRKNIIQAIIENDWKKFASDLIKKEKILTTLKTYNINKITKTSDGYFMYHYDDRIDDIWIEII